MSLRDHLHHLSDLLEQRVPMERKKDWPYLVGLFLITLLTGPLYLLASWIQDWNATTTPWDAKDHWDGTKQFALTFAAFDALFVALCMHFSSHLADLWSRTPLPWLLPRLALWWVFCGLLAPALALVLERIDPRIKKLVRVRIASEQPPPSPTLAVEPPVPQKKKPRAGGQGRTASASEPVPSRKKKKQGRSVPLGNLLLQEKQEREQRRTQINYIQMPLTPDEAETDSLDDEASPPPAPEVPSAPVLPEASPPTDATESTPSGEITPDWPPPAAKKPERRKPEPLDNLF